jgi:hypothetical protein
MGLDPDQIAEINAYCKRDLPDLPWFLEEFDFIDQPTLRTRLARAFYAARYIYKLMEALRVTGDELHAHIKFQIIQYASIYEAIISHLLWNKFRDHDRVKTLETHKSYKKIAGLAGPTKITYEGEEASLCVYRDTKTWKNAIKFNDRVDAAVDIGFVRKAYGEEIKRIYELRNLTHIETEAEKEIELEIENSKLAYRRMLPFVADVKEFLRSGGLTP